MPLIGVPEHASEEVMAKANRIKEILKAMGDSDVVKYDIDDYAGTLSECLDEILDEVYTSAFLFVYKTKDLHKPLTTFYNESTSTKDKEVIFNEMVLLLELKCCVGRMVFDWRTRTHAKRQARD